MIFSKGHFHLHQHDRPHGHWEGGRHHVSERLWHWAPTSAVSRAGCRSMVWPPWPVRTHQLGFPWTPLLGPMWLSVTADDWDDILRTSFIQFSNSRELGKVMSVLWVGWDLRMVPTEQIILPKRSVFSVMP